MALDIMLVLLKRNARDSHKSSGAFVHIFMSSLRLQTSATRDVYVTLVNKTVLLLQSYRDTQNKQD